MNVIQESKAITMQMQKSAVQALKVPLNYILIAKARIKETSTICYAIMFFVASRLVRENIINVKDASHIKAPK